MSLMDVQFINVQTYGTAGTVNYAIFKNITGNGKISIVDANIKTTTASTIALSLVYLDTTCGTIQGTVATWAGTTYAGTPLAATLASSVIVPEDKWLALQAGAGALQGAEHIVEVAYVKGV